MKDNIEICSLVYKVPQGSTHLICSTTSSLTISSSLHAYDPEPIMDYDFHCAPVTESHSL